MLCSDFVTKFAPGFLPYYFVFAMFPAFLATALVGALVEFLLIRHLYSRPLDTLLATFGVSLIMQQGFRLFFGGVKTSSTLPESC